VSKKLDVTWQSALTTQKANRTLGCITSSMASRSREGILPLYSALARAHLESCIHLSSPQNKEDMDLLEQAQRRATKIIQGPEYVSYEDRLRELGLFSLEKTVGRPYKQPSSTRRGPTGKMGKIFSAGLVVTGQAVMALN